MSAITIPALSVFGLAVELFENYEGDCDVLVTLGVQPRNQEAAEFVGHLQRLLQTHLGGYGLAAADAEAAYAVTVEAGLEQLVALNSYAAHHVEIDFWARMDLLGLGVLLHALSKLPPRALADWWDLYSAAGGDALDLMDALEATAV